MTFFAIPWSIWLHRNYIIFNQKTLDFVQLIDVIKLRLAWWFPIKWLDSYYTIEDIFWNFNECGVGRKLKASRAGVC
ncbi:hypothetical protein ES319_A13G153100v1 [Gossypium barbadense]|uniref:Uncharacterized protein n=2 Tax=Gossypium TaxID=3633 RepID=A0A5J5SZI3_GOSBA|nr:hypothetical protein ES319_A13G153100v1 [Gossypium barbadense]TYG86817.1 hypothetical protein ES288_A13G163400v1 [Gossypium darwinii]